jgi:hypothetical protein
MSPGTIADNVRASEGLSDTELVARLYDALATLPPAERAAAVVAIGLGEGPAGAAVELDLDLADADAVTRNALQLLRGALGDIDIDDPATYGRMPRTVRSGASVMVRRPARTASRHRFARSDKGWDRGLGSGATNASRRPQRNVPHTPPIPQGDTITAMPRWTAADIPDQTARTALVTGANSGLGFVTSLELARHGARVVLACRDPGPGCGQRSRTRTSSCGPSTWRTWPASGPSRTPSDRRTPNWTC